jgi:archaellum biogenesis protein FlaJ (TadC family)
MKEITNLYLRNATDKKNYKYDFKKLKQSITLILILRLISVFIYNFTLRLFLNLNKLNKLCIW